MGKLHQCIDQTLTQTFATKYRAFQSSAARNIPAGSQVNLDHVVAHYRNLHLAQEELKANKLAAQKE